VEQKAFAKLLERIHDGTISAECGERGCCKGWQEERARPDAIIEKRGPEADLRRRSDREKSSTRCWRGTPSRSRTYRAGKDKAFNSLVGQVMKATQGKANPAPGQRDPQAQAIRAPELLFFAAVSST